MFPETAGTPPLRFFRRTHIEKEQSNQSQCECVCVCVRTHRRNTDRSGQAAFGTVASVSVQWSKCVQVRAVWSRGPNCSGIRTQKCVPTPSLSLAPSSSLGPSEFSKKKIKRCNPEPREVNSTLMDTLQFAKFSNFFYRKPQLDGRNVVTDSSWIKSD